MDVTARIEMRPRSGCSCGAVPRRVAAHTTRARHLNLIPGCVWSLASPAAYIAAVTSAHARVCVHTCPYVPAVKVHSRTRYHKRGEWRPSSFPQGAGCTERERGSDLSIGDILQKGGARVHVCTRAPCTWHAEVDSATWDRVQRQNHQGLACLYVTL